MTLVNKCHLAKAPYSAGILDRRTSANLIEDVRMIAERVLV